MEHLEYVLEKLHKGGLTVNWEKSEFLLKEIHFLGFITVSYTHLDVYKRQVTTEGKH